MWYQGSWRILPNRGHELSVADRTILQSVRPANTNRPLETEVAASMRSNPPLKLPAQLSGIALACNQPASGDPGALTLKEEKMRKFVLAAALFVSLCVVATAGGNKELRQHLKNIAKETWQLVNWLTHDRNANDSASTIAIHSCDTVVGHFVQILMRQRTGILKTVLYANRAIFAHTLIFPSSRMVTTT
jgi:hypothetical protein